jgi:glycosyltransferase involved in cell wall biosynthesis
VSKPPLKVAIVHDWFVGGGAEKVVEQISQLFPDAPIYTSYCSPEWRQRLAPAKVITGYLQHWPFPTLRKFIPILRQHWFSHLDLDGYDLVISSSGAEAKGIRVPKGSLHVNYCHAPTHYYWGRYDEYLENPGFGPLNWLARLGLKLLVGPMRHWDLKAAQRPDVMIANSSYIQAAIKKYYGREATVIHPPVDVARFKTDHQHERFGFLVSGRQTPYKRFDLAVAACTKLELPLTVVGKGPDHKRLMSMAGTSVRFVTEANDEEVAEHMQHASAFIFPGLDDFGISAIEALAAGTPVIAYKDGGALDYIKPGVTGVFFDKQTIASLSQALKTFNPRDFSSATVSKYVQDFSPEAFRTKFLAMLDDVRKDQKS